MILGKRKPLTIYGPNPDGSVAEGFDPDAFAREQRARMAAYQAMRQGVQDNMAPLGSGSIWEGLARAGKSFIDTRGARGEIERQEAQRQALSEILAGSGGDRRKIFAGLAANPDTAGMAMDALPKEQDNLVLKPGDSVRNPNDPTQEIYTQPKLPDPINVPTGMRPNTAGQWEYDPNYLEGQKEIFGARATAGIPPMPAPPPGTVIK